MILAWLCRFSCVEASVKRFNHLVSIASRVWSIKPLRIKVSYVSYINLLMPRIIYRGNTTSMHFSICNADPPNIKVGESSRFTQHLS